MLYYSANRQELAQRQSGSAVASHVWSSVYIDALLATDRDADGNTGNGMEQRFYALQKASFNVTALLSSAGAVVESYYYQAYGPPTVLDANSVPRAIGQSQFAWRYYHQCGRHNWAAGLYHLRHQDLPPTLGRWASLEPIGFQADDDNLYRHAENGPSHRLDPRGLWCWDYDWIQLGLGGLLGFQGEEVQAEAGFNIVNNP